jgi:hypothetical protein
MIDHRHGRLLSAGAERQRRRSTKQSNKLALAELPSDEAPQSSTSLEDQGAVHRSDIFLLIVGSGQNENRFFTGTCWLSPAADISAARAQPLSSVAGALSGAPGGNTPGRVLRPFA